MCLILKRSIVSIDHVFLYRHTYVFIIIILFITSPYIYVHSLCCYLYETLYVTKCIVLITIIEFKNDSLIASVSDIGNTYTKKIASKSLNASSTYRISVDFPISYLYNFISLTRVCECYSRLYTLYLFNLTLLNLYKNRRLFF